MILNHCRQQPVDGQCQRFPPDSAILTIGAHNVYYVKSCLSDAKCFLVVVIRSGFKNLSLSSFIIGLCMEKQPGYSLPHAKSAVSVAQTLHTKTPEGAVTYLRTDQAGMSPLRYQKWLRLNEVRRPMLNEHYDVTTAAYAVGYESYPISVGNIRGCLESHPREILPG